MKVPNFVTVLGVRVRIIADGLAALYQIPVAVISAKGSGAQGEIRGGASGAPHPEAHFPGVCARFFPISGHLEAS